MVPARTSHWWNSLSSTQSYVDTVTSKIHSEMPVTPGIVLVQGLIWTAGVMWNVLHFLNIPIHVQEVCICRAAHCRTSQSVRSCVIQAHHLLPGCFCRQKLPLWRLAAWIFPFFIVSMSGAILNLIVVYCRSVCSQLLCFQPFAHSQPTSWQAKCGARVQACLLPCLQQVSPHTSQDQ